MRISAAKVRKPPASKLTITCPGTQIRFSTDGLPLAVTWTNATTTGGRNPVTVTYSPDQGSLFPLGDTIVTASAHSKDGQSVGCSFQVTVIDDRPQPGGSPGGSPTGSPALTDQRGPQPDIVPPIGAVSIGIGDDIQTAINTNPAGTTFSLASGIHPISASITPKTGNTFVGVYGAVLDGAGWAFTTLLDIQACFKAHNQNIDNVTFRNLVIRNMPARAIHAQSTAGLASGWLIENCEIDHNMYGIVLDVSSTIRNNLIHHNIGDTNALDVNLHGGWCNAAVPFDWLVENNEIAYNGPQGKIQSDGARITFRGNWVHHNFQNGVWFDGIGTLPGAPNPGQSVIEDNLVVDNGYFGIYFEASAYGIIRNNICNRNVATGIALGTSRDSEVYGNTIEDNGRGISLYVSCDGVGFTQDYDLRNNTIHDNHIKVPGFNNSLGEPYASELQIFGTCGTAYLDNTKNNTFTDNSYVHAYVTAASWFWPTAKTFTQWQAIPQDVGSTLGFG